jgi:hypothetical protein
VRAGLYCTTQPSIETSTGLTFTCWNVAYPELGNQFLAAHMDPLKNTWDKVRAPTLNHHSATTQGAASSNNVPILPSGIPPH